MPRGRPRKNPAAPAESDRRLLDGVRGLVERNSLLEAENRRLRELLDQISRSLRAPSAAGGAPGPAGDAPRRRGRPPKTPAPTRPRRKITDPEILEKRRAALTKARAVRAERLAAARD
jgi:hypothetical protein